MIMIMTSLSATLQCSACHSTSCHSPTSLSLLSSISLSVPVWASDAAMHPPPPPPRSIHSLSFLYYNYWSQVYSPDHQDQYLHHLYSPDHDQYHSLDSYSVSDSHPGYFSDSLRIRRHSGSSHVSHRHVGFDPRYSYKESHQRNDERNGTCYNFLCLIFSDLVLEASLS